VNSAATSAGQGAAAGFRTIKAMRRRDNSRLWQSDKWAKVAARLVSSASKAERPQRVNQYKAISTGRGASPAFCHLRAVRSSTPRWLASVAG